MKHTIHLYSLTDPGHEIRVFDVTQAVRDCLAEALHSKCEADETMAAHWLWENFNETYGEAYEVIRRSTN